MTKHKWLTASIAFVVVSLSAVVALGIEYHGEPDYWLVGIPGFGTAIGTIGLAGATFRLIHREAADRENTLTALRHSRTMATEAARQRRDARARMLRVAPWGPQIAHLEPQPAQSNEQDNGSTFDMPGDANKKLYISQRFNLTATDGQPMTVTLNGLNLRGKDHIGIEDARLPFDGPTSNDRNVVRFTVERTVAEWVAIAEQRENGEPGDEAHAWIAVDDSFDDGVRDTYELIAAGCPLTRSTELGSRWVLDLGYRSAGFKAVAFAALPVVRHYYVSKVGNHPLTDGEPSGGSL